jgi:hypothetical protein
MNTAPGRPRRRLRRRQRDASAGSSWAFAVPG